MSLRQIQHVLLTCFILPYFEFTEIHEQRLNDLRKKMVWLTETDWKYKRPEELIGLEKWEHLRLCHWDCHWDCHWGRHWQCHSWWPRGVGRCPFSCMEREGTELYRGGGGECKERCLSLWWDKRVTCHQCLVRIAWRNKFSYMSLTMTLRMPLKW